MQQQGVASINRKYTAYVNRKYSMQQQAKVYAATGSNEKYLSEGFSMQQQ
jgi:hypothetical protein